MSIGSFFYTVDERIDPFWKDDVSEEVYLLEVPIIKILDIFIVLSMIGTIVVFQRISSTVI